MKETKMGNQGTSSISDPFFYGKVNMDPSEKAQLHSGDKDFLTQVLLHLKNTNHPQLNEIFQKVLEKPPSLNQRLVKSRKSSWSLVKSKLPLFQKSIVQGIQCIPSQIDSLKCGVQSLSSRVEWINGAICPSIKNPTWGYNYAEIISPGTGACGYDSLYIHDSLILGLYVQAPGVNYPPHAHDAEEWYLVLSGNPQWFVNGEKFTANPGDIIHHPPRATHSMVTSDEPLLALWMRTGELDGAYWFVDESRELCLLEY